MRHAPTASEAEALVCAGRADQVLRAAADLPGPLDAHWAFSLGRAAMDEEDFSRARELFSSVRSGDDQTTARRAEAQLAYIDYYDGRFAVGLDRAIGAGAGARGIAAAEANLYQSVNLTALNATADALAAAMRAKNIAQLVRPAWLRTDLRFRIYRQLVHVLVARGSYAAAWSEAEAAAAIARRLGTPRAIGLAAYLRGYVLWARGDPAAVIHFSQADRYWGGTHHAFGRWLRYVWAMALRDQGDLERAQEMRLTSGVSLSWEDPLFNLDEAVPDLTSSHDELPFRQATAGLVYLMRGDLESAEASLLQAVHEFARCELEHYRRGASMALVAVHIERGATRQARAILAKEHEPLTRFDLRRWPWFQPKLARRIAEFCIGFSLRPEYWSAILRSLVPRPEIAALLRARELTEREIGIVLTWIDHSDWSRADLARHFEIREGTVRNLLGRAREKLSCDARRGPAALRERIDELGSLASTPVDPRTTYAL